RAAADGSGERVVAEGRDHVLVLARWSPDGHAIAAMQGSGTGTTRPEGVLFPLDGGAPPRLGVTQMPNNRPGIPWNGDGRGLLTLGGGYVDQTSPIGSRTRQVFLRDLRSGSTRTLLSAIDLRGSLDVLGPGSLIVAVGGPRSNLREVSTAKGEAGRWL